MSPKRASFGGSAFTALLWVLGFIAKDVVVD